MMNTLLLTGWGVDHACAAAVVLTQQPDAGVAGVSKRKLVSSLESLLDQQLERVLIVGVALTEDPHGLREALIALRKKSVQVEWMSVVSPPAVDGIDWGEYLVVRRGSDTTGLTRHVAELLGADCHQTQWLIELAASPSEPDMPQVRLLNAAMSRYRRFGDSSAFPQAIKRLRPGRSLTADESALVVEFESFGYRELRGRSAALESLRRTIRVLGAEGSCRVLITGETGTGKETVAYLIHRHSLRAEEPFWAFNCADLSPQLLESRLFGYEKGAFTGALARREGAFMMADNGTLFLDEVGELSSDAQAGLLRVLQEQRFRRIGGEEEIRVNVRIISATNRDLMKMVADGQFRMDLYYRLSTVEVKTPPLRERREDIADIANDYRISKGYSPLTATQAAELAAVDWPGNVRQLQNILERAMIFDIDCYSSLLERPATDSGNATSAPISERLQDHIHAYVHAAYIRHDHVLAPTARTLGITVNTLKKYLAAYAQATNCD